METDSPVVYHGTSESRFPPESAERSQMQLSPEEIRTLRECNRESFYYRCLPYAMAGMTATFLAVKQGYLKGHPKFGPAGKMTGAAVAGWFLGKFSYRKTCEDKFLKLENSAVGNAIRKRRGYTSETFDSESKYQKPMEEDLSVKDSYNAYRSNDYHSSSGSLNLDVDKNVPYAGLDDRERPSTDRENYEFKDDSKPPRSFTTYEEMRRKNREAYERQQMRPQYNKSTSPVSTGSQRHWRENDEGNLSAEGNSTNQYGDSWDNPKFT